MFGNKRDAERIKALEEQVHSLLNRVSSLEYKSYVLAENKDYNPFLRDAMFEKVNNSDAISRIADHLGIKFQYSKGTPHSTSIVKKPKAQAKPRSSF